MDLGNLLGGTGVMLGASMAGAGALKLFLSASHSVARIPAALERSAEALEREADVAEKAADLTKILSELREGQEQIRITMSTQAERLEELAQANWELKADGESRPESQHE